MKKTSINVVKKARLINTFGTIGGLAIICLIYFVYREGGKEWLYFLFPAALILSVFAINKLPYIDSLTEVRCANCGNIIEKGKYLGDKLPKKCQGCGLTIE